jgi:hypothetical protein
MEATFWVFVGSGREKVHLHVYGDIHDWIVVKWGNFLMGKRTCIHQMRPGLTSTSSVNTRWPPACEASFRMGG